jgi:hypothetical protein
MHYGSSATESIALWKTLYVTLQLQHSRSDHEAAWYNKDVVSKLRAVDLEQTSVLILLLIKIYNGNYFVFHITMAW